MIRTRFAPSPTGSLHIGNARIAVLNWLLTRQQGGSFVLRIEDTDLDRNIESAEAGIRQDLLWLGLEWDEGPGQGTYGPYRQSERGECYERYARRLRREGRAYPCFCAAEPAPDRTATDTADLAEGVDPAAAGAPAEAVERRGGCPCAQLPAAEATRRAAAESHTLRFRVPPGETIAVDDVIRGRVEFASDEIADFVLMRSDGRPTYNFAVVVDDIEMRITHVIRGVGHLSNTPRQALLFDALAEPRPGFAHVPMVLGPDRQKLSKRHGAAGMAEYRTQGYHPDGLLNYLSLLSWASPSGEDVLTREQLIEEISLERIGVADAMFDPARLSWLSARHIERMSLDALVAAVRPFVDRSRFDIDDTKLRVAVAATRTHYATFADVNEQLEAFLPATEPVPRPTGADGGAVLDAAVSVLDALPHDWQEPALKSALQEIGRIAGVKGRALYEPLRVALTGSAHGPPLPAVLYVQGREAVLDALRSAP